MITGGMGLSKMIKLEYDDCDTPYIELPADHRVAYHIYNMNGAFDVNAATGSTVMPGFLQWGEFFNLYRVITAQITVNWMNTGDFPVYVGALVVDATYPDWPGVSTDDDWKQWYTQLNSRPKGTCTRHLLTAQSGNRATFSDTLTINMARFIGQEEYVKGDLNWQATFSANPIRKVECALYAMSANGNLLPVTEIYHQVKVRMWVKMSDRVGLDSTKPEDYVDDTTLIPPDATFTGPS